MKKATKHVILIVLLVLTVLVLTSCTSIKTEEAVPPEKNSDYVVYHGVAFESVAKTPSYSYYVFRETLTNFMYYGLISGQSSFLAPLFDPDTSLPLTYARYLELTRSGK